MSAKLKRLLWTTGDSRWVNTCPSTGDAEVERVPQLKYHGMHITKDTTVREACYFLRRLKKLGSNINILSKFLIACITVWYGNRVEKL